MAAKFWWLMALAAVLQGAVAVLYFVLQAGDAPLLRFWAQVSGEMMLAASVCLIAAGLLTARWWMVLNGVALIALGLVNGGFVHGRISFRFVAMLFVLNAVSLGLVALRFRQRWGAVVAGCFELAFLAMGLRLMRFDLAFGLRTLPDYLWWKADFLWFSVYFVFSAICLAMIAWHAMGPRYQLFPWGDVGHGRLG
jgi:hypothetical protein